MRMRHDVQKVEPYEVLPKNARHDAQNQVIRTVVCSRGWILGRWRASWVPLGAYGGTLLFGQHHVAGAGKMVRQRKAARSAAAGSGPVAV